MVKKIEPEQPVTIVYAVEAWAPRYGWFIVISPGGQTFTDIGEVNRRITIETRLGRRARLVKFVREDS